MNPHTPYSTTANLRNANPNKRNNADDRTSEIPLRVVLLPGALHAFESSSDYSKNANARARTHTHANTCAHARARARSVSNKKNTNVIRTMHRREREANREKGPAAGRG